MDRLKWRLVVVAVICVLDLTVTSIIEQGTSLKFLYRAKLCLALLSGPVSLFNSMLLEDGVTALIRVFWRPPPMRGVFWRPPPMLSHPLVRQGAVSGSILSAHLCSTVSSFFPCSSLSSCLFDTRIVAYFTPSNVRFPVKQYRAQSKMMRA
jgi:hypothetical protein